MPGTHHRFNSHGRRIRKTGTQGDTRYHYDAQHRLIAEHAANGTVLKEYPNYRGQSNNSSVTCSGIGHE